jgi:hypothetical protein
VSTTGETEIVYAYDRDGKRIPLLERKADVLRVSEPGSCKAGDKAFIRRVVDVNQCGRIIVAPEIEHFIGIGIRTKVDTARYPSTFEILAEEIPTELIEVGKSAVVDGLLDLTPRQLQQQERQKRIERILERYGI